MRYSDIPEWAEAQRRQERLQWLATEAIQGGATVDEVRVLLGMLPVGGNFGKSIVHQMPDEPLIVEAK